MSWACWVIARQGTRSVRAVLLAAALLVGWDLLLDPAMSKVTSYWVWAETGTYYDMPLMNLVGWGVTGLVLFIILNKTVPNPRGRPSFSLSVYLVNFSLPLGFCILNGYWLAAIAAPAVIALAWVLATRFTNPSALPQHAPDSLTAAPVPQRN
jgi:putative membrane protein